MFELTGKLVLTAVKGRQHVAFVGVAQQHPFVDLGQPALLQVIAAAGGNIWISERAERSRRDDRIT